MADRPFVFRFASDVADLLRGTKKAETALDAVADELKRVDSVGSTATDQLTRDLRKVGEAAEAAERDIKTAFRKVPDDVDAGTGNVAESGRELGAEFAQNLGEGLSSGDITSLAQDTAGGLVSAFSAIGGPIGLAFAGVAAGAATVFATMQKAAQETADRISAVFDQQLSELGTQLDRTARGAWVQSWLEQLGGDKGIAGGMKRLDELTKGLGVSTEDVIAALIQGGPAAAQLEKELSGAAGAGVKTVESAQGITTELSGSSGKATELISAMHDAGFEINTGADAADRLDEAVARANGNANALTGHMARVRDIIDEANRRSQVLAQNIKSASAEADVFQQEKLLGRTR